jgi:hypothetical protein
VEDVELMTKDEQLDVLGDVVPLPMADQIKHAPK